LRIKLKGCHIDTFKVIEAELRGENTLTEHDLWDAFKHGRSVGNRGYAQKGTTLRVMMATGPEVDI
jgi:hypothetical protein